MQTHPPSRVGFLHLKNNIGSILYGKLSQKRKEKEKAWDKDAIDFSERRNGVDSSMIN